MVFGRKKKSIKLTEPTEEIIKEIEEDKDNDRI